MLATTIGLCLALLGAGPERDSTEYRAAYAKGRAEADRELERGDATLYLCGLVRGDLDFDHETGLPYKRIAGCIVDDAILGRHAGHNDRIMQSIKSRGLPLNSYKPWERELSDLKGYFAARSQAGATRRLVAYGPGVWTQDGRYAIRLRERPKERVSSRARDPEFLITAPGTTRAAFVGPLGAAAGKTEVFWGPESSHLAFIRWSDYPPDHKLDQAFVAIDAKSGEWVRAEVIPRRRPAGDPKPPAELPGK